MDGISRRELIKRSAVAGGVLWATPALTSGVAWGAVNSCDCDGSPVYTKIAGTAGNDAQTCGNQCLQPVGLPSIGFGCLEDAGYVATTRTSDDIASVEFQSKSIFLNRMSLKVSEACYMITCVENFGTVFTFDNASNNIPELKNTTYPDTTPAHPLFKFEDGDGASLGDSNNGAPAGSKVRKITWDSTDLRHKVNFIEFILCVQNLSRIPCEVGDDC